MNKTENPFMNATADNIIIMMTIMDDAVEQSLYKAEGDVDKIKQSTKTLTKILETTSSPLAKVALTYAVGRLKTKIGYDI